MSPVRCDMPPKGWACRLPINHDGPCPAWPTWWTRLRDPRVRAVRPEPEPMPEPPPIILTGQIDPALTRRQWRTDRKANTP